MRYAIGAGSRSREASKLTVPRRLARCGLAGGGELSFFSILPFDYYVGGRTEMASSDKKSAGS
jgi:hypothetical protein